MEFQTVTSPKDNSKLTVGKYSSFSSENLAAELLVLFTAYPHIFQPENLITLNISNGDTGTMQYIFIVFRGDLENKAVAVANTFTMHQFEPLVESYYKRDELSPANEDAAAVVATGWWYGVQSSEDMPEYVKYKGMVVEVESGWFADMPDSWWFLLPVACTNGDEPKTYQKVTASECEHANIWEISGYKYKKETAMLKLTPEHY